MTVAETIRHLEKLPPAAEVVMRFNPGIEDDPDVTGCADNEDVWATGSPVLINVRDMGVNLDDNNRPTTEHEYEDLWAEGIGGVTGVVAFMTESDQKIELGQSERLRKLRELREAAS